MMENEVHTAADVQQQIDAFCAAGDCAMAAAYGLEALKVRLKAQSTFSCHLQSAC